MDAKILRIRKILTSRILAPNAPSYSKNLKWKKSIKASIFVLYNLVPRLYKSMSDNEEMQNTNLKKKNVCNVI